MIKRLSSEEFYSIYTRVPRICVDLVIKSSEGILLSLRAIEPCIGEWHLPGGTIYFGESIENAAKRIALAETGLNIQLIKQLAAIEFLETESKRDMYAISIAILAEPISGELKHDFQASDIRFFKKLPENVILEHGKFLKQYKLL